MRQPNNKLEYMPQVPVTPQQIESLSMALVEDDLAGQQWTNEHGDTVSAFTFLVEALDCCQEALYKLSMESGDPLVFQHEHAPFYHAVSNGCSTAQALLNTKYPAPSVLLSSAWRRAR